MSLQPGPALSNTAESRHGTIPNLRWYICGLLFFATTVNYVDRQILGILKPLLQERLHWSESDYGWIVGAFTAAYALMTPVAGRIIDRVGTRIGYALAVVFWSLASMSHALAHNALQFGIARFLLGIGEAANFPAAIKTVADWFPKRERALATGIFNSGSNVGALIAPLLVPFFASHFGWQSSFLANGALDFIWLACWLLLFREPREHRRLSRAELNLIESDQEPAVTARIPWSTLIRKREAWAFLAGKLMTDPVWWFYLYWLPGFLSRTYGLDLTHLGPPLVVVYFMTGFGSIGGGWLSSTLLKRGWTVNSARKTTLFICACCALPVVLVMLTGGRMWYAVALVSLAASAHQGWSANLFTLVSDTFPRSAVASVVGLGTSAGSIAMFLVAPAVGRWLDISHDSYGPLFFIAGSMYLLALVVIHLLVPKIRQAEL